MYTGKAKLILAHRLLNPSVAEKDLALLKELNPSHPELSRFHRFPSKCAAEILHALLDVATEQDILQNRKGKEEETPHQVQTGEDGEPLGMFKEPILDGGTDKIPTESPEPVDDGADEKPTESTDNSKKNDPSRKSENTPT